MSDLNLNFDEIGRPIRINVGSDISLSSPTLILLPEIGNIRLIVDGVSIPSVDVVDGNDTYLANQYIEYFTKLGDLNYAGRWKSKAKLNFSTTDVRQTDYQKFRVLA